MTINTSSSRRRKCRILVLYTHILYYSVHAATGEAAKGILLFTFRSYLNREVEVLEKSVLHIIHGRSDIIYNRVVFFTPSGTD